MALTYERYITKAW